MNRKIIPVLRSAPDVLKIRRRLPLKMGEFGPTHGEKIVRGWHDVKVRVEDAASDEASRYGSVLEFDHRGGERSAN